MREYNKQEQNIVIQSILNSADYFLGHIKALGSMDEWKNIIEIKKKITEQLKGVKGEVTEEVCIQQANKFWNERKAYYDKYSEKYPGADFLENYKVPEHICDNQDYIALTAAYMDYILVKINLIKQGLVPSCPISCINLTQDLYEKSETKFCFPWLEDIFVNH